MCDTIKHGSLIRKARTPIASRLAQKWVGFEFSGFRVRVAELADALA